MSEVLTAREAEALYAAGEQLQVKLDAAEAARAAAEERAERIAADMDLLEKELRAKRRQVQNLAQERNAKRELDPDNKQVNEIWDYYRDRTGHKRMTLDGDRFDLIKKALKIKADQPDPVAALKRAIDGAAAFPFVVDRERRPTGKYKERFDGIDLVFRNAKYIEKFTDLAERAAPDEEEESAAAPVAAVAAGDARTQVTRFDPTPLERAVQVLGLEFGIDLIETVFDPSRERLVILEHWAPCPVHPIDAGARTLRIRHRKWGRVAIGSREAPEFACRNGCSEESIRAALMELEAAQEARSSAVVIPLRREDRAA